MKTKKYDRETIDLTKILKEFQEEPIICDYKIQVTDHLHEINEKKFFKTGKFSYYLAQFFDEDIEKCSLLNEKPLKEDNEFFLAETDRNLKIIEEKILKMSENSYLSTIASINSNNNNHNKLTSKNVQSNYINAKPQLAKYKYGDLIKELKKRDKVIANLKQQNLNLITMLK